MDLGKLSPAPWQVASGSWGNGGCYSYVCNINHDTRADGETDREFITLARNAFDVMMRRGWTANWNVDKSWGVQDAWTARYPKGLGGQGWPDPFTALVEADRWYKENVEKKNG